MGRPRGGPWEEPHPWRKCSICVDVSAWRWLSISQQAPMAIDPILGGTSWVSPLSFLPVLARMILCKSCTWSTSMVLAVKYAFLKFTPLACTVFLYLTSLTEWLLNLGGSVDYNCVLYSLYSLHIGQSLC